MFSIHLSLFDFWHHRVPTIKLTLGTDYSAERFQSTASIQLYGPSYWRFDLISILRIESVQLLCYNNTWHYIFVSPLIKRSFLRYFYLLYWKFFNHNFHTFIFLTFSWWLYFGPILNQIFFRHLLIHHKLDQLWYFIILEIFDYERILFLIYFWKHYYYLD